MAEQLDSIVIGAGVVGLAVARSLALAGREVIVLEAEHEIGMHTSSRNSEVIHAGLYYPEDSLKAKLCVSGKQMLYSYCEAHRIPHQRIGKLVVASQADEVERLLEIREQAGKNGVHDLEVLDADEIRHREPAITGEVALFSPSTGIIDSHALMLALQAEIEAHDGAVVTRSPVERIDAHGAGFRIHLADTDEAFDCRVLVNAAGLRATDVARSIAGLGDAHVPTVHFAKGHYFAYAGRSPFRHLVYPLPFDGGLGVHATNDMGGAARFGPDVEWIDDVDYAFGDGRKDAFLASIRHYFPGVDADRLAPSYTGIRPKLAGPGEGFRDFLVQGHDLHGIDGLVNLFGFDSPGLTASLAIGEHVAETLAS